MSIRLEWEVSSADGLFVSARSCHEYEGMFDLNFASWHGKRILDCGAGGASFVAEWSSHGGFAVACDPLYGESSAVQESAVHSGVERAARNVAEEPEMYVWENFENPLVHREARERAAEAFLADRQEHPEHYVEASLPDLPFANNSFDLVVSSHLLFAYCRTISIEDHLRFVSEMVRVSSVEVRLYPLIGFEGDAREHVARVLEECRASGLSIERRPSRYHLLRGATEYLAIGIT